MILIGFVIGGETGAGIAGGGAALFIGAIFGSSSEVRLTIPIGLIFGLLLGSYVGHLGEEIGLVVGALIGMLFFGVIFGFFIGKVDGAEGGVIAGLVGGTLGAVALGFLVGGSVGMYFGFLMGPIVGFFVGVTVGWWSEEKKREIDNRFDYLIKYKEVWKFAGVFCLPGLLMVLIGFIIEGLSGSLIAVKGIAICIGAVGGGFIEEGKIVGTFVGGFIGTIIGGFILWQSYKHLYNPDGATAGGGLLGMFVGAIVGWISARTAEGLMEGIEKKKEEIDEESKFHEENHKESLFGDEGGKEIFSRIKVKNSLEKSQMKQIDVQIVGQIILPPPIIVTTVERRSVRELFHTAKISLGQDVVDVVRVIQKMRSTALHVGRR